MPLLTFILVLIAIGVVLWAVFRYIPMDADVKQIIKVVVIIALIIWCLDLFGLLDALRTVKVGRP